MCTSRPKRILAVLGIVAAAVACGAGYALCRQACFSTAAVSDYPDAPFLKVPKDYPEIIPLEARPSAQDKAALDRYREKRRAAYRRLAEEGAIRRVSAEEREAVLAVADDNYIRGRELAEKILRGNPQSAPALCALTEAEYYGESNLPRALGLVRRLRHLVEQRGLVDPADGDSREWYLRALELEYEILSTMDRSADALEVVRLLGQVYADLPSWKIWPLFKLNRLDEARQAIDAAHRQGGWKMTVLNCRSTLAQILGQRGPQYEAAEKMVEYAPHSPLLWRNFGESAEGDFRLDEAEKAFLRSAKEGETNELDYRGTPFTCLAQLYLQQGRFQEAVDSLRKARADRGRRPAFTLQEDQAEIDMSLALLLLALGQHQDAERFARRAYEHPDRTGHSTRTQDGDVLTDGVVLWTILQARIEELRERQAGAPWLDRAATGCRQAALEYQTWTLRRQLLKRLMQGEHWAILRPYLLTDCDVQPWLLGSVIRILPSGAAAEAIRRARAEETNPAAGPYFDAIEAELALDQNDLPRALELACRSMAGLPAEKEKLLRNRVSAVGAEAARRLGRTEECLRLANQAMADFPQVFRLLETRIPVRVQDDGSPLARALAGRLLASCRFVDDRDGFSIVIHRDENRLAFEMFRLGKARHFTDSVPIGKDGRQAVQAAVERFYQRLMSPTLDLTQIAINSLDGSPAALHSQQAIDTLLDKVRPR
jgi:tetratricopeptide (TPR) repeat protein